MDSLAQISDKAGRMLLTVLTAFFGFAAMPLLMAQPGHGGWKDSCQAMFGYAPHPNVVNRILFTNLSTGPFDHVFWEFGDGDHSPQMNPSHQYNQPGAYEVCLKVWHNDSTHSCSDTFCDSVYVGIPIPCQAGFNAWPTPTDPLRWVFHAQVQGNVNQWLWDFGDGQVGSGLNIEHHFADTGHYLVCLRILGPACEDTACKLIPVISPGYHNLAGQVFGGPFPAEGAMVQLFRKVGGQYMLDRVAQTDSLGVYWFYQVLGGQFILRAREAGNSPAPNSFLPTYFPSDIHWFMADEIMLNQDYFGADISLKGLPGGTNGSGTIGGQVVYSDDRPDSLSGPAAGVDILLLTQSGHPMALRISDALGNFQFMQVNYGNLRVHAEIPGIQTVPAEVQLNPGHPVVNDILLEVQPMMVLPVQDALEQGAAVGNIFPNPTSGEAWITLSFAGAGEVQAELHDLSGRRIGSTTYTHQGGEETYMVKTGREIPGVYLLKISMDGRYLASRRVVIMP